MPYKDPKHPNRAISDWKYRNTERGFVMKVITSKFRPSSTKWRPTIDKKEMWRSYMNHIADMKRNFPSRMVDFVDIVRNLLLGNLRWVPVVRAIKDVDLRLKLICLSIDGILE